MIIQVKPPSQWPKAPEWMSLSLLREIESCPRKWGLSNADYPDVWSHKGYPKCISVGTLIGIVVHRVVKIIVDLLVLNGCKSTDDASAVGVMKSLGGFSKLTQSQISIALSPYQDNPRVKDKLDSLSHEMSTRIGDIRLIAQAHLRGMKFHGFRPSIGSHSGLANNESGIPSGDFTEIQMDAQELKFRGIADLLKVSDYGCEIVEYKSGSFKKEHLEQLKLYSLLWLRCKTLNPTGRIAEILRLKYRDGEKLVGPWTESELQQFELEIVERTQAAIKVSDQHPLKPFPEFDKCRYCQVRHLCEEYWKAETQTALIPLDNRGPSTIDAEVEIAGIHGSKSFDAISLSAAKIAKHTPVLLRTVKAEPGISEGSRVRVLDALFATDGGGEAGRVIITMGNWSELFLIDDGEIDRSS